MKFDSLRVWSRVRRVPFAWRNGKCETSSRSTRKACSATAKFICTWCLALACGNHDSVNGNPGCTSCRRSNTLVSYKFSNEVTPPEARHARVPDGDQIAGSKAQNAPEYPRPRGRHTVLFDREILAGDALRECSLFYGVSA